MVRLSLRNFFMGLAVTCLLLVTLSFFYLSFFYLSFFPRNSDFPPDQQMHSDGLFHFEEFFKCQNLFVFGDSTVDSGMFNVARYPYEMDFHEGYNGGRFSNGKTPADYLASSLGKSLPLPYRENMDMLPNVPINFASGGCGILDATRPPPSSLLKCYSLKQQVNEFIILKKPHADDDLFFFSIASNDFIFSFEPYKKTPEVFVKKLVSDYLFYIEFLYELGARKFLISNIGPLGCIPEKRIAPDNECNEDLNEVVQDYNSNLTKELKHFVKYYEEAQVVLADCDAMFSLFLRDPNKYGFKFTDKPCCGTRNEEQRFECNEKSAVCEERQQYMFFDGVHPTQQANFYFIKNCLSGNICKPIIMT